MSVELEEAKRLYQSADFAAAITQLRRAIDTLEPHRDLTSARDRLADAYLHLGLAYCATGDLDTAKDAFRNVLRLDPERRLDTEVYAPKVVDLFERARMSMPPESEGPLAGPAAAPPRRPNPFRERPVQIEMPVNVGLFRHLGTSPPPRIASRWQESMPPLPPSYRYRAKWATAGLRASVRLPSTLGLLRVGIHDGAVSDEEQDLEVRRIEGLWTKVIHERGALRVRRDLGVEVVRINEDYGLAVGDFTAPPPRTTLSLSGFSRYKAYGGRLGYEGTLADNDTFLGMRAYLDFGFGLTLFFGGTDTGEARLVVTESVGSNETVGTSASVFKSDSADARIDGFVTARLQFARGVDFAVSYFVDALPAKHGLNEATFSDQGFRITLALRIGRD